MKKRILVFSPPFAGHLNVLKTMISEYGGDVVFKLVITGWKNIKANLDNIGCETTVLEASDLHETDPVTWTAARVEALLPSCLEIARNFKPDLILYDFFSLEGWEVGRRLRVPYWSSIPAMIGPFTESDREYLKNKGMIDEGLEMISDGLHRAGQLNIVWSYSSLAPTDFHYGRTGEYAFVGNPQESSVYKKEKGNGATRIYVSLGTVVMNNIWNQRIDVREQLCEFIGALADIWKDESYEVLFVTQGKQILGSYPKNWRTIDHADQMQALAWADIFVTHGGSNSFHEAVINKVPMAVIPFFGDQPLVAAQVEKLGIGINLVPDVGIDTHEKKDFLGQELAARLDSAVRTIVHDESYRKALAALSLEHASLKNLFDHL